MYDHFHYVSAMWYEMIPKVVIPTPSISQLIYYKPYRVSRSFEPQNIDGLVSQSLSNCDFSLQMHNKNHHANV